MISRKEGRKEGRKASSPELGELLCCKCKLQGRKKGRMPKKDIKEGYQKRREWDICGRYLGRKDINKDGRVCKYTAVQYCYNWTVDTVRKKPAAVRGGTYVCMYVCIYVFIRKKGRYQTKEERTEGRTFNAWLRRINE
jgi:hypothetical protein